MSQTIVSPPLSTTLRRLMVGAWNDADTRGVVIGIIGAILIHLLLFLIAPFLLRTDPVSASARPHAAPRQFSIELAPDTFVQKMPPPKPPMKFVETNPDAPENIPDNTNNFAAQNQQVAQEKPSPDSKSEKPKLDGQKDIHSEQIVTGQLTKPVQQTPVEPPVEAREQESKIQTTRPEQNPLAGFEKKIGEDADAFGTNISKPADNTKNIPDKIEGAKNVPLIEGATAMQPAIDPHRPRPRPQIVQQQRVRPAIFEENKFGTSNIGIIGVNAKFSNYGAYLQRLVEAVQVQWDQLLMESRIYPPSGSMVTVKFILDSKGKIARVVEVENKATEAAARTCVNAITARSPYGEWTDDMKSVLGDEQEMTFSFYYQ